MSVVRLTDGSGKLIEVPNGATTPQVVACTLKQPPSIVANLLAKDLADLTPLDPAGEPIEQRMSCSDDTWAQDGRWRVSVTTLESERFGYKPGLSMLLAEATVSCVYTDPEKSNLELRLTGLFDESDVERLKANLGIIPDVAKTKRCRETNLTEDTSELMDFIRNVKREHPGWGYRTLAQHLGKSTAQIRYACKMIRMQEKAENEK